MRFYKQQHQFYCGIDLHAKTMHVCLVDQAGEILVHQNLKTQPDRFLSAISPYRKQDLVVGVECMFCGLFELPFLPLQVAHFVKVYVSVCYQGQ